MTFLLVTIFYLTKNTIFLYIEKYIKLVTKQLFIIICKLYRYKISHSRKYFFSRRAGLWRGWLPKQPKCNICSSLCHWVYSRNRKSRFDSFDVFFSRRFSHEKTVLIYKKLRNLVIFAHHFF